MPSLATGDDAPAVEEFFLERAAAAGGGILRDDTSKRAIVGDVVEQLDGIPLAIELAASRTRSMSVTKIRDLLDDRFRLLSGGSRRMRQRQATLEGGCPVVLRPARSRRTVDTPDTVSVPGGLRCGRCRRRRPGA